MEADRSPRRPAGMDQGTSPWCGCVGSEATVFLGSGAVVVYLERSDAPDHALSCLSEDVFFLVGYRPSDCLAAPDFWPERVHCDDRAAVWNGLAEVDRTGRTRFSYRFRCSDGEMRLLTEDLRRIEPSADRPARILGSLTLLPRRTPATTSTPGPEPKAGTVPRPAVSAKRPDSEPDVRALLRRAQVGPMLDDLAQLAGVGIAISDLTGSVLVASGWREVCTKFHRAKAASAAGCVQSDRRFAKTLKPDEYAVYQCCHGLWDVVTPLYLDGTHLGNIYTGQFLSDDDGKPPSDWFVRQAERYGYDREAYLEAVSQVPRFGRERMRQVLSFLVRLSRFVSESVGRGSRLVTAMTVSRRMTAALREDERRLRTLMNAMPDLVCLKDGHGRWQEANAFTCRLLGVAEGSYQGKTNRELAHASPLFHERCEGLSTADDAAWCAGRMVRCEETFPSADGKLLFFDVMRVPLFYANGSRQGLVLVGRDVTQQREAGQALSQFNRKLESVVAERTAALAEKAAALEAANTRLMELDAVKSSFVSAVSHEVRTPLTSILGFVRLIERDFQRYYLPLERQVPSLADKGKRIVANLCVIDREGDRLKRLINDFLDLAKIEYGSLRWKDAMVSPNVAIAQVAEAVQGLFSEHPGVSLRVDAVADLPCLWIDFDRLQQVLYNLISNAVKFTPAGTVTVRAYQPDAGRVALAVSDTGIGIAPEELGQIFEKFHQVPRESDTVDHAVGTGLGLTICRQIVQHYGGTIWAESEPGRGSSFHVILPITQREGRGEA